MGRRDGAPVFLWGSTVPTILCPLPPARPARALEAHRARARQVLLGDTVAVAHRAHPRLLAELQQDYESPRGVKSD